MGRTGFVVTLLGVGDLADRSLPIETCVATARRALDAGLNVIDTAPNYEDGYSEEIVGRAVRGVRRDAVFVIDKIDHHEEPICPQIDGSFTRLGLGHTESLDVGTVCFKTFGAGKLVGDTSGYNQPLKTRPRGKVSSGGSAGADAVLPRLSVAECLHYTLTLEPDVALLGMS